MAPVHRRGRLRYGVGLLAIVLLLPLDVRTEQDAAQHDGQKCFFAAAFGHRGLPFVPDNTQ